MKRPAGIAKSLGYGALLVGLASTAVAAEPVEWKFTPGETLRYEVRQTTEINVDAARTGKFATRAEQRLEVSWQVESTDKNQASLVQTIDQIRTDVRQPDGMELTYDSTTNEPATGIAAMLGPMFDALLDAKVPLVVTTRGELKEFKPDPELVKTLQTVPATKGLGDAVADAGLQAISDQVLFELPAGELTPGATTERQWSLANRVLGDAEGTITWKYTGQVEKEGRQLHRFEPAVELTVEEAEETGEKLPLSGPKPLKSPTVSQEQAQGEALFDAERGRLSELTLHLQFQISGMVGQNEVSSKIDQSLRVEPNTKDDE